jgi:hypothetical protein
MSEYVLEIIRGGDHVYLTRKDSGRSTVTPQERNAVTFNSCADAKQVIDDLMGMPMNEMRKLLKVSDTWVRPVRIMSRKRLNASPSANSRLYQFKEQVA